MTATRHVCQACRQTVSISANADAVVCVLCGGPVTLASSKWRAPRKTNDAAWRRVSAGVWLWDQRAVERAGRRLAERIARVRLAKAARRP